MAKIDRLIGILVDKQIPLAALQPDTPVMLDMGGGDTRSLNEQAVSARRVEMLLSEILPEKTKEELRFSGRAEFRYDSPHGSVSVTALRRGGKLSVYLSTAGLMSGSESSVVADATFRRGNADLRDQAVRSARSVVPNMVEGAGKTGRAWRHSLTVALGEAGEACSAIGMARLKGASEQQDKLRRVGLMLRAMIR